MPCRLVDKSTSIIDKAIGSVFSPSGYVNVTSAMIEAILTALEASAQATTLEKKKQDALSYSLPTNVFAIGKRLFAVDQNSYFFNPQRKQTAIDTVFEKGGLTDPFKRFNGSYWTINSNKDFVFLKNSLNKYFSVLDYSLLDTDVITLKDSTDDGKMRTLQWISIKAQDKIFEGFSNLPKIPYGQSKDFNEILKETLEKTKKYVSTQQQDEFKKLIWNTWLFGGNLVIKGTGNDPSKSVYAVADKYIKERVSTTVNRRTLDPLIQLQQDFFEHSFELSTPFSTKEIEGMAIINKPVVAKVSPEYNFLIEKYENTIGVIPEHLLPNLYVLYSEMVKGVDRKEFEDHLTVGGRIPFTEIVSRNPSKNRKKDLIKINGQYFEKYARAFDNLLQENNNPLTEFSNNFKNLIVSSENVKLLKEADERRFLFPMYVDFEFSTDTTAAMTQVFQDSKVSPIIMKSVIKNTQPGVSVPRTKFFEINEILSQRQTDFGSYETNRSYSFTDSQYRVWDLTEMIDQFNKNKTDNKDIPIGLPWWWTAVLTAFANEENKDIGVFLGQETDEEKISTDPTYRFFATLMRVIFVGKIRKLIKQYFRTLKELMEGKPAYSETVMYRIEKFLANEQGKPIGNPIQNFYLPNTNQEDVLRFVDTQVKYGIRYAYKIYAYQAVIGTKYRYEDIKPGPYLTAAVLVSQEPSVKLIEVPYFSYTGAVVDSPPAFPDVNVVPYRSIKDKILFLLNANTGEYTMMPIAIDSEDEKIFDEIRKIKDLNKDDPIKFETDDHSGFFQIFRSEKKPLSWKDFSGKLLAQIETDVSKISLQKATSAAFVDTIEPNKKYYYTFRVIDYHGHISNPSPIYEVELVAEKNTVFPLISTVDFAEGEIKRKSTRQMKRYIKISPALGQTIINEKKSGLENKKSAKDVQKVFLGTKDESVWGSKFKVRLISKQSGKKIDFNVTFGNRNIRTSKEEDKQDGQ